MNLHNVGHIIFRGVTGIILSILMLYFSVSLLYAAGDDFFLRQEIDVSGQVLGSLVDDFNGDGLPDLILVAEDADGRRTVRTYIQREHGRFPPTAAQIFEVAPSANMIQALDINGDGKKELFLTEGDGLREFDFNGDKFNVQGKSVVNIPTLFAAGIEGGLVEQNCIQTVSGRPVAFIPVSVGFSLWAYSDGKFSNIGMLNFSHLFSAIDRPVKLFGGSRRNLQGLFQVCIPNVVISDSNGDDLDDVYLVWPDRVAIITQDSQNGFNGQDDLLFRFQAHTDGNLCQSRLVDYDGDGRLDIVCSHSAGGISGAQTDINFYHSTQIRRLDHTESYSVSLTDACGNLMIDDFDRSGRPELVVPAIELGIMSTVKKMITKKTDFHILIYPIDNLGRPAHEPKVRKKISCRLDFENADPTANIRINWSGDYDGDGLPDLIVADGGGQLMFYRGTADDYLEDKAVLVIDLDNPDEIMPTRLNNDAGTDLVIIHKPAGGITRLTLLVTSRIG